MSSWSDEEAGARERHRDGAIDPTTPESQRGSRRPGVVAASRWVLDVGLWLVVSIPVLAAPAGDRGGVDAVAAGSIVASLVLLVLRHRWPVPALAAGLIGAVAVAVWSEQPTALLVTSVVLIYTVAVRSDRATAVRAGLAGVASSSICIALMVSQDFIGPELLAGIAWPSLAAVAGDAVRSRRDAIVAAQERAERAEATREHEARRRVAEERLHIARELHDVIAHGIAVINVQAGVAAHQLHASPEAAADALATVRASAGQVLEELASLLDVLRADGPTGNEPAPTIDGVPSLVASFDQAGLDVELEVELDADDLRACVNDITSTAIYRTIQEALTNAHKHGDGTARVAVTDDDDAVRVTISNRVAASPSGASTGFGLIGMRERVQAVGGHLQVGPQPDGTYLVRATFPHSRQREAR